jgi:hypothetical protein
MIFMQTVGTIADTFKAASGFGFAWFYFWR